MVMNKRHMVTIKRSVSCSMPGVWRAVAHSEGAVVIFHAPRSCGHVTRDMELNGYYHEAARQRFFSQIYTAPLITSNLREEHAIFGGAEQLTECIDYTVKRYNPRYILIANSCVAGVIGDDTQTVARDAELKWGIPVLTVPASGFLDGEYYAGFYYATKALVDRFMEKRPAVFDAVTLLGDRGSLNSEDTAEIEQMLEGLGFRTYVRFPVYASLEEMAKVGQSACSILLGGRTASFFSIRQLAVYIQEKLGVPFFDNDYPIGLSGTQKWLEELGVFLRREESVTTLKRWQEERLKPFVGPCRDSVRQMKVALCIGRPLIHFRPDWVLETADLVGMELAGIVLFNGLTPEQKTEMIDFINSRTDAAVLVEQEAEELIKEADLVLTTHELEDRIKRQYFLPVLPPLGIGGIIRVLNHLTRLSKKPACREAMVYGW